MNSMTTPLGHKILALVAILTLLAVQACGSGSPQATSTAPKVTPTLSATTPTPVAGATQVPTAVPKQLLPGVIPAGDMTNAKYGGTERVFLERLESQPDVIATAPSGEQINQGLYSKLVMRNQFNTSEIVPDLATSWRMSDDGVVYTFNLRKDVVWHDGTPFTAHDAVATYDFSTYIWRQFSQGRRWGGFLDDVVKSSRAIDEYTFEVTLKFPYADFVGLISSSQLRIAPRHKIEPAFAKIKEQKAYIPLFSATNPPVGTGPFKFDQFQPGIYFKAVRNDKFYDQFEGKRLPFLDGYESTQLVDHSLQLAAFATNKVDVWPAFPTLTTKEKDQLVQRLGNKVRVHESSTILGNGTQFNMSKAPTNEPDFRKAIVLIIDLEDIKKRVYPGGAPMGFYIDPVAFPGWDLPEEERAKVDWVGLPRAQALEKARKLLAGLGYTTPQDVPELNLIAQNSSPYTDSVQVKAAQLSAFGIKVRVDIYEATAMSAKSREGLFDIRDTGAGSPVLYPLNNFEQGLLTENAINVSDRWVTPKAEIAPAQVKVRELYNQAARTIDPTKRKAITYDILRTLYVDSPKVPTTYPTAWMMPWSHLRGFFPGVGLYEHQSHRYEWLNRT